MNWIYLSPHLDDAALSCGGLIWEQSKAGAQVSIWTICAGDPPTAPLSSFAESLHTRWQTGSGATEERRQEDIFACQRLGATYRHFPLPDCIYRLGPDGQDHLYDSEEAIFGSIHPNELALVEELSKEIAGQIPGQAILVSPMALGGHVDHRLTRQVAERLSMRLVYYLDYPYVLKNQPEIEQLRHAGWGSVLYAISEDALAAWQAAIAAHTSQISTFWPNLESMAFAIREYRQQAGGIQLWMQSH